MEKYSKDVQTFHNFCKMCLALIFGFITSQFVRLPFACYKIVVGVRLHPWTMILHTLYIYLIAPSFSLEIWLLYFWEIQVVFVRNTTGQQRRWSCTYHTVTDLFLLFLQKVRVFKKALFYVILKSNCCFKTRSHAWIHVFKTDE